MAADQSRTIWASHLGEYVNSPERFCLRYLKLPESQLAAVKGFVFHTKLAIASSRGKEHLEGKTLDNTAIGLPTILGGIGFLSYLILLLGIVHDFLPAGSFVYFIKAIIGFGALYLLLAFISIVKDGSEGLPKGEVLAMDNKEFRCRTYNIACRPDRVIKPGKHIIPEEWKSYDEPKAGDRYQLAVAMLATEKTYGRRPPHGMLIMGDYSRIKVKNTKALRKVVTDKLEEMRMVLDAVDALKAKQSTT